MPDRQVVLRRRRCPSTRVAATCTIGPKVMAGSTPTTTHSTTSSATGAFMNRGGSCGCALGQILRRAVEEHVVDEAQRIGHRTDAAEGGRHGTSTPQAKSVWPFDAPRGKNISLDRKPLASGRPAIAAAAIIASVPSRASPHQPAQAAHVARAGFVVDDAGRHEQRALKVAWFRMWNTAATADSGEARPIRKVISPGG
jgi:hypothetical protein